MISKNIPRKFSLSDGKIIEIFWHHGLNHWRSVIHVPNYPRQVNFRPSDYLEFEGIHGTSPLMSFKKARLAFRMHLNLDLKKVCERLDVGRPKSLLEQMQQAADKMMMSKNGQPRRYYMNRKAAENLQAQMDIYSPLAKQAGLTMPIIIVDELLEDRKILEVDTDGKEIIKI